jgi:hypothetical protein
LTTLIILAELWGRSPVTDACRRIGARIDLKAISNIASAQRLPQVENGKRRAGLKLLDVSELVQEQFLRRANFWR